MSASDGTSPLAPSTVLGGLRLLRRLGRGGMAKADPRLTRDLWDNIVDLLERLAAEAGTTEA